MTYYEAQPLQSLESRLEIERKRLSRLVRSDSKAQCKFVIELIEAEIARRERKENELSAGESYCGVE